MQIEKTEIVMSLTIREAQSLYHLLDLLNTNQHDLVKLRLQLLHGHKIDCDSVLYELGNLLHFSPYRGHRK